MSDTETNTARPWHGSSNPLESLHDWMMKELAAIKSAAGPSVTALEDKIAVLEATIESMANPAPVVPAPVTSGSSFSPAEPTVTSGGTSNA